MANEKLKNYIKSNGLFLWQIADEIGMHDSNFSKLLRTPLDENRKRQIDQAIKKLTAEREADVRAIHY